MEKQYAASLVIKPERVKFAPVPLQAKDDESAIKEMEKLLKLVPLPVIKSPLLSVHVAIICRESGAERVVKEFHINGRN